jgi:uncharacterized membrane protein YjfL (UPF0719 family)
MLTALGFAAAYGFLGIVLAIAGYFLFDVVEYRINFADEIKKGNTAAAIVIAAFIIGVCFIVGRAIGS